MPGGRLWCLGPLGSKVTGEHLSGPNFSACSGMGLVPSSLRGHPASRRSGRKPISKAGDDNTCCEDEYLHLHKQLSSEHGMIGQA